MPDRDLSRTRPPEREAWAEATDLVRRIQNGDPQADDEFIRRYQRGVTVIVTRASRDRLPVEDLCQDVLSTALERIRAGAVRGPERLSGFVAGLARMTVLDHFRKEATRAAIDARIQAPAQASPATALDQLLREEAALLVREVLGELESDRDREMLFRFYLAEQDKAQICRDLQLTPLHFNRVLFRARERYRALYRERIAARRRGLPR